MRLSRATIKVFPHKDVDAARKIIKDLRLDDDFTARQIHAGIAYWLLIIVAIHLGLRWPLLMAVARRLLGIAEANMISVGAGFARNGDVSPPAPAACRACAWWT